MYIQGFLAPKLCTRFCTHFKVYYSKLARFYSYNYITLFFVIITIDFPIRFDLLKLMHFIRTN